MNTRILVKIYTFPTLELFNILLNLNIEMYFLFESLHAPFCLVAEMRFFGETVHWSVFGTHHDDSHRTYERWYTSEVLVEHPAKLTTSEDLYNFGIGNLSSNGIFACK